MLTSDVVDIGLGLIILMTMHLHAPISDGNLVGLPYLQIQKEDILRGGGGIIFYW